MNKSSFRWIVSGVILLALAALVIFVYVPIYQKTDVVPPNEAVVHSYMADKKQYTLENDSLLFTMDAASTQFTVKNKLTGQEWYSNPKDAGNDKIAVASEKEKLQSLFLLTYTPNIGASTTLNSYAHSTLNEVFTIEPSDDEIAVHYSVGKIKKIIPLPQAITKARMDQFTEGLSKKDKNTATAVYKLYDPAKLKDKDKKEVLPLYPDLNNEPVYVMLGAAKDVAKNKALNVLQGQGYTTEEYEYDMSRFAHEEQDTSKVYNITLRYRLSGNDLIVEAPFDEMEYPAELPITELIILPYMGAANATQEGYIMVPEGSGAIINYNNGKQQQTFYNANVYGWDYAQDRTVLVSEPRTAFPMFAATSGNDSFLCMLENGASYANIKSNIAGRTNSYNYAYAAYTMVHRDMYNVTKNTTELIYMTEGSLPAGESLKLRYRFLGSDNYVDMAHAYGDYLVESGILSDSAADKEVPIVIDLLGAIDKTEKKMGVPVRKPVSMTSFAEAAQMVEELNSAGLNDLYVRYNGWANNGVNQKVLTKVKPVEEMGGEKALKSFLQTAQAAGNDVYLDGMSEFAYESGMMDGLNIFKDVAQYTTRNYVELQNFSPIYYYPILSDDLYYLVKPSYMLQMAKNLSDSVEKFGANGISYRDMGYLLSADYDHNQRVSREASSKIQVEAMQYAADQDQKIMIRAGNVYALHLADIVTHMDLAGIDYNVLDDHIPFFPIALHGRLNYTAEPLNMAGDIETALLRSAEYGAGIGFTFMHADASALVDTDYTAYISTAWQRWKEPAIEIMTKYRDDMAGLFSQKIVDHYKVSANVSCTQYEDGTKVYVNYGFTDVQAEDVTVPARSYQVKGVNNK